MLNIEEPHSAINEIIKYKEFNLDVFFSKKKVFDAYESYDAYCAEFESHVVGQVINESQVDPANEYLVDDGKAIDEFDFYFDVTIYGLTNISVEAISPSLLSDLPNMNIITVKFNDSSTIVDTTVSGRYTLKGTNEEKTIENKREILNDASKDKIKNTLYS
ncbi:MAG: hypothetical protein MJ233_00810 [Mycoplasmoidaceae bacterium]|nr:hypothetical protein [Mycoplasmoidaceae bacterium]